MSHSFSKIKNWYVSVKMLHLAASEPTQDSGLEHGLSWWLFFVFVLQHHDETISYQPIKYIYVL